MAAINRGNVSGTTFYMALGPSLRSIGRGAEFWASFDCAAAVAQWTVTDWTHSTSLHAVKSSKLKRVLGDGQAINLFNVFKKRSFAYLDFSKGVIYHPRIASSMRRRAIIGENKRATFVFVLAGVEKWGAKLWPRFALNLLASPHWNDVSYGRSFILTLITQFVPLALINLHVWFIIEAARETPRDRA